LVLELLRQRGIFCIFSIGFVSVATAWHFLYFFYWYLELFRKKYKKYHAVATVPNTNKKSTKNATLSQQLQNQ
jgi:restriction endonuclease S subunit